MNLVQDTDILSMGIIKSYTPPNPSTSRNDPADFSSDPSSQLQDMCTEDVFDNEARREEGLDLVEGRQQEHHQH